MSPVSKQPEDQPVWPPVRVWPPESADELSEAARETLAAADMATVRTAATGERIPWLQQLIESCDRDIYAETVAAHGSDPLMPKVQGFARPYPPIRHAEER